MQCSKVLILFLVYVFSWAAIGAASITIRQAGNGRIAFEVEYTFGGKHRSQFSEYFSTGQQKTIDIPPRATDIHLSVCSTGTKQCETNIFTKFYQSPVSKCFTVTDAGQYTEESFCPLKPTGGYSMTVHQAGNYETTFEVKYKMNGSIKTDSSGDISNGKGKTVRIPDGAVNITFTLYRYGITKFTKEIMATRFYTFPVQKCFETRGSNSIFNDRFWFEKACQKLPATKNNLISVRQTSTSSLMLNVTYNYEGSYLAEIPDKFSKGVKRTISIPDQATDIKVTLLKEESMQKMKTVATRFYSLPVKKCFKAEISYVFDKDLTEETC